MTSDSRRSGSRKGARAPRLPESVLGEIERHLSAREQRRVELHEEARRLRRSAQVAMTRLHAGSPVEREMTAIRAALGRLTERLRDAPEDAGLADDAVQEAVEAILLERAVRRAALPGPSEIGVGPELYLLGLGDLVGELRRLVLADLVEGAVDRARDRLEEMEATYQLLLRFESPRSIVALKPKQDSARALLERTRSDVALAVVLARATPPARARRRP